MKSNEMTAPERPSFAGLKPNASGAVTTT